MYIEPKTNIKILKGVPLDTTYEHTLYFNDASEQLNYFSSKVKYNLINYTYQRVNHGVARVGVSSDALYDCNYMMFQNSAYGNKWFYAFITSVEYHNNGCTDITFEIDVMQTWFFDYTIDYCFVEREHSEKDELWSNLVPENLELGDYKITKKETFDMSSMNICALTSKTSSGASAVGRTINHVYVPLNVIAGIPSDDANSINSALEEFVGAGQEDAIVTLYQYPSFLGDASTTEPQKTIKKLTPDFNTIDGYTPKNNKLFSYPYMMLVVSNNCGQTSEYRWEQWSSKENSGRFALQGVFVSTPCVICFPTYYRGIAEDVDSGITYSNFPQVPWVGDTYKAWLAQNKGTIASGLISSALGGALTVAGATTFNAGLVAGGSVAISNVVGNLVGKKTDTQNTPPQVHGQVQCDSLNAGAGRVEFTFNHMVIKQQFARIIDDYFTMYGYATNRCKTPNRSSRPHWNFVKTAGVTLTGSVPCDDMRKICSIYDNGVTFWKNGVEVGHYNLDNSPST